jgi:predicted nucleic acid-binding protein
MTATCPSAAKSRCARSSFEVYVVDTNILSTASPTVKLPLSELVDWLDRASPFLFLSVVTAAEVADGIAKKKREGATRKAGMLRAWWDTVEHLYADRILPFDLQTARIAGRLMDGARGRGHEPGFPDTAIAATAVQHHLTVLTRNVRDFKPLGVPHLNPYEALPPMPVPGSGLG